MPVLTVHVLLYYGIANAIPAMLPELRPVAILGVTGRIPMASGMSYAVASLAGLLLLSGAAIGWMISEHTFHLREGSWRVYERERRWLWLPSYRLSVIACIALIVAVGFVTVSIGTSWGAFLGDYEMQMELPTWHKVVIYGVIRLLPVAPILAASAYLQAKTPQGKRCCFFLLVSSSILMVLTLAIWGMRTNAMISVALPVWMIGFFRERKWSSVVLRLLILSTMIYGGVSVVRLSQVSVSLVDPGEGSISHIFSAVTRPATDRAVLDYAVSDASYRMAGLEANAALIEAQETGLLRLRWGKVMWAGFIQALPAWLRSDFLNPERIKTAPAHYGIFAEGDWVSSVLAESVMDFGPIGVLLPGLLAGFVLNVMDRTLLWFGSRCPSLEGLLVIRLAWLVQILDFTSLADVTILFLKAVSGFIAVFVLVGFVLQLDHGLFRRRPKRAISAPVSI
jgi:hypothetical protein